MDLKQSHAIRIVIVFALMSALVAGGPVESHPESGKALHL